MILLYCNDILSFDAFFENHNKRFEKVWDEISPLPYKPDVKALEDLYNKDVMKCYIAVDDNRPVGFVVGRVQNHLYTSKTLFTLDSVHLYKEVSSPKLVKKLLVEVKKLAKQLHCDYVIITVPYAKMGMGRDKIHSIEVK